MSNFDYFVRQSLVSVHHLEVEAWTRLLNQRTMESERVPYLSFRPPELGQPFWSPLLLVVASQELKCLNPKYKLARRLSLPNRQNLQSKPQRVHSLMKRSESALTRSTSLATETATTPTKTGARPKPS